MPATTNTLSIALGAQAQTHKRDAIAALRELVWEAQAMLKSVEQGGPIRTSIAGAFLDPMRFQDAERALVRMREAQRLATVAQNIEKGP